MKTMKMVWVGGAVALVSVCATILWPHAGDRHAPTLTDDARGTASRTQTDAPSSEIDRELLPARGAPSSLTPTNTSWEAFTKQYTGTPPLKNTPGTPPSAFVLPQYDRTLQKRTVPTRTETLGTVQRDTYVPPRVQTNTVETDEDKIRRYGNAMGDLIQTAIRAMGDQNARMSAFIQNTQNAGDVLALAEAYDALARQVEEVPHVPGFTASAARLADGYRAVARGTRELSGARTADLYDHLLSYNTHVETFAKAFIDYASLFGAYGVTFSTDEPGGIFTPHVGTL